MAKLIRFNTTNGQIPAAVELDGAGNNIVKTYATKVDFKNKTTEIDTRIDNLLLGKGNVTGVKGSEEEDFRVGQVTITKANIGLGNVTNDAQVKRSEMGQPSGVATLGIDGKVPKMQLPTITADLLAVQEITDLQISDYAAIATSKIAGLDEALGDINNRLSTLTSSSVDGASLKKLAFKDTVGTVDIDDDSITSAKILDGSITTAEIAEGAVTSSKIAPNTIIDDDISLTAAIKQSKIEGLTAIANNVASFQLYLPENVSASNKLVDMATLGDIASKVSPSGRYIVPPPGTSVAEQADIWSSLDTLKSAKVWYHGDQPVEELLDNDYATYEDSREGISQHEYWTAVYIIGDDGVGSWHAQHKLGSVLTSAQQAAIDSGITKEKLTALTTDVSNRLIKSGDTMTGRLTFTSDALPANDTITVAERIVTVDNVSGTGALSYSTVKDASAVSNLGWTATSGRNIFPNLNALAYWDGAKDSTSSSLKYYDSGLIAGIARGSSFTANNVILGAGGTLLKPLATGTAGQVLQVGENGVPAWAAPKDTTYGLATTANNGLFFSGFTFSKNSSWGALHSDATQKIVQRWDSASGGSLCFFEKEGALSLEIDGDIYVDEGAKKVATETWVNAQGFMKSYTLPTASSTVLGGVKLGSDTPQTVAANDVTTAADRTYAIQKNAAGQLVVNVPWSDTVKSDDSWRTINITDNADKSLGSLGSATTTGALTLKAGANMKLEYSSGKVIFTPNYSAASTTANGLMSSTDKSHLESMWNLWGDGDDADANVTKVTEVLKAFENFPEANNLFTLLSQKANADSYLALDGSKTMTGAVNIKNASLIKAYNKSSTLTDVLAFDSTNNNLLLGNAGWNDCIIFNSIVPQSGVTGKLDLGDILGSFKDLYLSGTIVHGSATLTLPSTTGTLALKSDIVSQITSASGSNGVTASFADKTVKVAGVTATASAVGVTKLYKSTDTYTDKDDGAITPKAAKALATSVSGDFVTLSTEQTVTGLKKFTNADGIYIGNAHLKYDTTSHALEVSFS